MRRVLESALRESDGVAKNLREELDELRLELYLTLTLALTLILTLTLNPNLTLT